MTAFQESLERPVDVKPYLVSLVVGFVVGLLYAALGVRPPAPPLVGLCGLLGIILGGEVLRVAPQLRNHESAASSNRTDPPAVAEPDQRPTEKGIPPVRLTTDGVRRV